MKIREFIASQLADRQLTHEELARKMGCSRSQVSLLLSGKRQWKEKYIDAFFSALGIDIVQEWDSDVEVHRKIAEILARDDKDAAILRDLLDRF